MQNVPEGLKIMGDVVSVATVSAAMMQVLPPMAALLTVIWSVIRILETRTVQKMFGKGRHKRTRKGDEDEVS